MVHWVALTSIGSVPLDAPYPTRGANTTLKWVPASRGDMHKNEARDLLAGAIMVGGEIKKWAPLRSHSYGLNDIGVR